MTFRVQVRPGVPYKVWLHVRRGTKNEKPVPSLLFVQFDGAGGFLPLDSPRFHTVRGPAEGAWGWVSRDLKDPKSADLVVTFATPEARIRVTGGCAGAGFDQLLLSPAKHLERPPAGPFPFRPR